MDDYISFEQIPFGSDTFADNPEPRCPCLLLLDTSGSMSGLPIAQLNKGIEFFKDELLGDPLASKRVEVGIVTFGPVKIQADFQTAYNFNPSELYASGDTPMGSAITMGIDLVAKRKQDYKENGISYYKPWIILITDGAPTDSWREAASKIREGEEKNSFAFFAVGVEDANFEILRQISVRQPLKLQGLKFKELFEWLSGSMKIVSSKNPGASISMLPPTGWAEL